MDRSTIIFVNPSSIPVRVSASGIGAMPGTEKAALGLAQRMVSSNSALTVHYVGNTRELVWEGVQLYPMSRLEHVLAAHPSAQVIWIRTYGGWADLRQSTDSNQHFLWSGDSIDDLRALQARDEIQGSIENPFSLLAGYEQVILVSEWQKGQWENILHPAIPLEVIYNFTRDPDSENLSTRDMERSRRVLNCSHPRKSLALYCAVARISSKLQLGYKFLTTSAPSLYGNSTDEQVYAPMDYSSFVSVGTFMGLRDKYSDVVDFFPPQDSESLQKLMSDCCVLLHPDMSGETGSMVVIEAMKTGCIPIVSSLGALPELVGDCGLIVEGTPGSRSFLQNCVRLISLAQTMSIDHQVINDRFGEKAIADQWLKLLHERP